MNNPHILVQGCKFETARLLVNNWMGQLANSTSKLELSETVLKVLTPEVTRSLPPGWQDINTIPKAEAWIDERSLKSTSLAVQIKPGGPVIGFMFLHDHVNPDQTISMKLGYLLSKQFWGRGLASELIKGLVDWCLDMEEIVLISGGVEINNIGSVKVLERNGFSISKTEIPPEGNLFLERSFRR